VTLYATEVRAAEDARLLGYVNTPVPSHELPHVWKFVLRGRVGDTAVETIAMQVDEYAKNSARWRAFKVSAALWEKIKDEIR
jgi:hypothetical protein